MTFAPSYKSPLSEFRTKRNREIVELRKEAESGSRQALRGLWAFGYVVVTIGGRQINLREMFGERHP